MISCPPLHTQTERDYVGRVNEFPKAQAAKVTKKFWEKYWDGDRKYGCGGYSYDGRKKPVAEYMIEHYDLGPGNRVLDVGCGKAYLIYDMTLVEPELDVHGIDISEYAVEHAKEEIRDNVQVGNATDLPWPDDHFDYVMSINTIHNLPCHELEKAIQEIERVGKDNKYICVESYRNEEEKVNLLYWQLTCESFYNPDEWDWWFEHCGYTGDHSFIYFE